jgi:glycosyltransferase involved in cell wall biosynthesis
MVGGPEQNFANLGGELAARGHEVTVLTARWQRGWPAELLYRGRRVVRLAEPPRRRWGAICYTRALARWLRRRAAEIDVVCVSRLREEAYAAVRALRGRAPVVLRAETAGRAGDCRWLREAPCGWRIRRRCRAAAAHVAASRTIEEELRAAGFPAERLCRIAPGVPIPPACGESAKADLRATLAEVVPSLRLAPEAPLAVYTGRLLRNRGLSDLVAAWQSVAERRPEARLWLVGQGRCQRALEDQIEETGLLGKVVLAGVFDHVDEILAAADLFVQPSAEGGLSLAVVEAMAAGLPVIAADVPDHRDLLADEREGLLVRGPNGPRLAAAVLRLLDDAALARRLGGAARQRAAEQFTLARQADDHLRLWESLVDSR